MNWLQKLGKGIKAVFGQSTLDATKVFNTLSSKMDDWNFTEEEKARYNKEAADAMATFAKDQLAESTERAQARRDIARLIIYFYLANSTLGIVFLFINPNKTKLLMEFCEAMYLTVAFLTIIAFFFGGYYINQFRGKNKEEK